MHRTRADACLPADAKENLPAPLRRCALPRRPACRPIQRSYVPCALRRHIEYRQQNADKDLTCHGFDVEHLAFHGDPINSYEHYIQVAEPGPPARPPAPRRANGNDERRRV